MPDPVFIAVAPNGGRLSELDVPGIPLTPEALASTASECLRQGASMMHIHVRDEAGQHLLDATEYRRATDAIRNRVGDGLLLQITSEALGIYSPAQQMAMVRDTRPEAVSLALREVLPEDHDLLDFRRFCDWLANEGVFPQFILYDQKDARRLATLLTTGALPWRDVPVLYVIGRYVPGQRSSPKDLVNFLAADMPRFTDFATCAFGQQETACTLASALLGGSIRVGFENNHRLPDGTRAAGNGELVGYIAHLLRQLAIPLLSASQLRCRWRAVLGY